MFFSLASQIVFDAIPFLFKIPTKVSVVSGREQLDHGKGLDHFGIGPEFKCSLDCVDGRKFNADVKTDVMDAHFSGDEKVSI